MGRTATRKQAKAKIAETELIRLKSQLEVLEEAKRKQERTFALAHKYQPGQPASLGWQDYTLKNLFVFYKDGIPYIKENWEQDPVVENGEFRISSPVGDRDFKYLERLSAKELERLVELNELASYEYSDIDSKVEAKKLEEERYDLFRRCGHEWKYDSRIFSNQEAYQCQRCYWTIENNQ